MKINIIFSQVEGPAVAALTENLADVMIALSLQGTPVELSLQCETPKAKPVKSSTSEPDIYGLDDDELPTELTTQEDYYKAQESLLKEIWGPDWKDDDPDEWSQENL